MIPSDGIFTYEMDYPDGRYAGDNYARHVVPHVPRLYNDYPKEIITAVCSIKYKGRFDEDEIIQVENMNFYRNCPCPGDLKSDSSYAEQT